MTVAETNRATPRMQANTIPGFSPPADLACKKHPLQNQPSSPSGADDFRTSTRIQSVAPPPPFPSSPSTDQLHWGLSRSPLWRRILQSGVIHPLFLKKNKKKTLYMKTSYQALSFLNSFLSSEILFIHSLNVLSVTRLSPFYSTEYFHAPCV